MREKILDKHINIDNLDVIYTAPCSETKDYVVFCHDGKETASKVERDAGEQTIAEIAQNLQEKGYENIAHLPGCLINLDNLINFNAENFKNDHFVQLHFANGINFDLHAESSEANMANLKCIADQYCNYYEGDIISSLIASNAMEEANQ